MIILEWYLRLNTNRFMEKGSNALKITNSTCKVKAGNTSESLLNEIRQIIYSLYQAKKLLKRYIIR